MSVRKLLTLVRPSPIYDGITSFLECLHFSTLLFLVIQQVWNTAGRQAPTAHSFKLTCGRVSAAPRASFGVCSQYLLVVVPTFFRSHSCIELRLDDVRREWY